MSIPGSFDLTAVAARWGGPSRLLVSREGIKLEYPNGKEVFSRWPGRLSYWRVEDFREVSPPLEDLPVQGRTFVSGGRTLRLTGPALDGILSGAKDAGLLVTTIRIVSRHRKWTGRFVTHYLQLPGFFNSFAKKKTTDEWVTVETH